MPGATATSKKVKFGIESVYYALLDESDGTFGTPTALPGAVSLSIEPEGDDSDFYADNTTYATFYGNQGYTGDLEIAYLSDDAAVDLLGYVEAGNGITYEDADIQPSPFALLFKVKGNVSDKAYAFYRCQLSRPSTEANTTTDTIEPDTDTLSFRAMPLDVEVEGVQRKLVKGHVENDSTHSEVFSAWFTEVQLPGAVQA